MLKSAQMGRDHLNPHFSDVQGSWCPEMPILAVILAGQLSFEDPGMEHVAFEASGPLFGSG